MQEEIKKGHTATEKQPEKKKVNLDIRPYLAIGLTAILVVMICIAIFFVILRFDGLFSSFQKILQSLQAIVVGLIVAYLLNPIVPKMFNPSFRLFCHSIYSGVYLIFLSK